MMEISDIYVSASKSILRKLSIIWCKKNIQHSMLSHPDLNNNVIGVYKQEILPTFILEHDVYIIYLLNRLNVEVIDNNQC